MKKYIYHIFINMYFLPLLFFDNKSHVFITFFDYFQLSPKSPINTIQLLWSHPVVLSQRATHEAPVGKLE